MTMHRCFRSLPLLLILLLPAGCATMDTPAAAPEITAEELRQAYDASRTHEYPNVSVDKAVKAAARIFDLADGGYSIIRGKGGVIAHRERTAVDGMLSGETGDYWYVDVLASGSGVVMRVRRAPEADPNTSLDPVEHRLRPGRLVAMETLDPVETWESELRDSAAMYAVFFKRMDWLLARNKYWLYCRAAEEYVRMEKLGGTLDAFCLDTKDKRPEIR